MTKRKVGSEGEKTPKKKLKSEPTQTKAFVSKLSFDSSEQCFSSLLYPTKIEDFFSKYWEKEPLFVGRYDKEYYKDFPTRGSFEEIARSEELKYDKDVFPSVEENTKDFPESDERVTVKTLQKYFKNKLTVLFNKPHRFHGELYRLVELLEGYFGCIVDCFMELHSEGAHGRKPGYTGKEEFILQVEGKKRWTFYKPVKKLSFLDSEDLKKKEIGGLTHEFLLQPGDLLYFPRGTVHQSHSMPGEVSSHIVIELYDELTWGHFLANIFDKAIQDAHENDVTFREGLPINFISYMGYAKRDFSNETVGNDGNNNKTEVSKDKNAVVPSITKADADKQKLFKEKLDKMLYSLAQYLDPHWGTDVFFGKPFIHRRLAPRQDEVEPCEEEAPTDDSLVKLKNSDLIRIMYSPEEDGSIEAEDESEVEEADEEDIEEAKEMSVIESKKSKKSQNDSEGEDDDEEPGKISQKNFEISGAKSDNDSLKPTKEDKNEEEASEEDLDDESFEKKQCIVVCHCLCNMLESDGEDMEGNPEEWGKLEFPLHFRDALLILHRSTTPIAVHDLPLNHEDRMDLITTLWCEQLLIKVEKS